jgi:hypothetical protein
MQTVERLIEELGGQAEVARHVGVTRQGIERWCHKYRLIPAHAYGVIVDLAAARGLPEPDRALFRFKRKPGSGRTREAANAE